MWTPRRVLIVDDNVDSAEMLAVNLQMAGHDVRTTYSGQDALRLATEYRPDVVLLDLGMPGMDGYEIARRLRELRGVGDLRIVAITGYGEEAHRRRTRAAGFSEHLVKPVDLDGLTGILSAAD